MAHSIGQTIRKLRKERNLTQEELAEQLNVTAKAVSKWENETGLPDISQVVPLANVFGAPTDILFGTANLDPDAEVERIINEASAPRRLTYETDEEDFAAAQTEYDTYIAALGDYPNNVRLLYAALGSGANLADDYAARGDHARAADLRQECIRQANVILRRTDDITMLLNTRMWLVRLRCDMKEYTRAEEEAEQMPHGFTNEHGLMQAWIRRAAGDTDGEIEVRCNNIARLLDTLADEIGPLGWAYADKGQYEDAYRVFRTLFDLLPVLYGDEPYTPPMHTLHASGIAYCCLKLGQPDEAVEWFWRDFDHLCRNAENYNREEPLETPLLRACKFRYFGEAMSVKQHMEYIHYKRFKPLFDYPRYRELAEKLESMP